MSEGASYQIKLSVNEDGDVLDKQENVLPLRIPELCITGQLESDQTAQAAPAKLIKLRGREMLCNEENLGELLEIHLNVTGEPDEQGYVTIQFPVS
jgi:hypothetical protein